MKTVIDAVNEFKGDIGNAPYCSKKTKLILVSNGTDSIWYKGELVVDDDNYTPSVFNLVCTIEEFNQCVEDCSNNFGNKAMTDDKFEFHNNPIAHTITSSNILCCAVTGRVVAVFYNESDLQAATGLIKKVELINGMAYQFDVRDKGGILSGIYNDFDKKLHVGPNHYFDLLSATNIQLLEVK